MRKVITENLTLMNQYFRDIGAVRFYDFTASGGAGFIHGNVNVYSATNMIEVTIECSNTRINRQNSNNETLVLYIQTFNLFTQHSQKQTNCPWFLTAPNG